MPTSKPAVPEFEEDYEDADFASGDAISFRFRKTTFTVVRMTMTQRAKFMEGITDGTIASDHDYFSAVLDETQFARFIELADDDDNPPKPATLANIMRYVQGKLNGGEDPKQRGSSPTRKGRGRR